MFRNYKYISHGQRLMWIIWVNDGSSGKVTLYLLSWPQCLEVRAGKMVLNFDNLLKLWELTMSTVYNTGIFWPKKPSCH